MLVALINKESYSIIILLTYVAAIICFRQPLK
jgi:hypothetical protein